MPTDIMPLINLGAVGVVLAWFMLRAEKKFDAMTNSINILSKTLLLAIVGSQTVEAKARLAADLLLRDLEAKG